MYALQPKSVHIKAAGFSKYNVEKYPQWYAAHECDAYPPQAGLNWILRLRSVQMPVTNEKVIVKKGVIIRNKKALVL